VMRLAHEVISIARECRGAAFGGFVRDAIIRHNFFHGIDFVFHSKPDLDAFHRKLIADGLTRTPIDTFPIAYIRPPHVRHPNAIGQMSCFVSRTHSGVFINSWVIGPNMPICLDTNVSSLMYDGERIWRARCPRSDTFTLADVITNIRESHAILFPDFHNLLSQGNGEEMSLAQARINRLKARGFKVQIEKVVVQLQDVLS
jgi:hypothetical protein